MKFLNIYKTTCWFTLFCLTACGGGGGGGGGTNNNPSSATQSSQSSSSQPVVWIDTGTLGNNVLVVNDLPTGERSIERLKEDGTSLTLTPKVANVRSIAKIRISPDGKKVAYLADQQTDNRFELFVSNTEGTFNKRVSAPITDGDILDFSWSDNSNYLIYKHEAGEIRTFYKTQFDGSNSSVISYKSSSNTQFSTSNQPEFIKGSNNYRFVAGKAPEQHLVVVDSATNQQVSDTTISDNLPVGYLSPDGRYAVAATGEDFASQNIFIRNIEASQTEEIYTGQTASSGWSPINNKLVLFKSGDLSVYDAETKLMTSLLNLDDYGVDGFSWNLLWQNGSQYLIFETSGTTKDLFILPTDGSTPVLARQTLGLNTVYSTVRWHDVSIDNRLMLITDESDIYTMNLDGSNAVAHTEFQSVDSIKYGFWNTDSKSLLMQNYDTALGKNVVTKLNLENSTSANISGNRDVACFLIATPSKSQCVLFFDER